MISVVVRDYEVKDFKDIVEIDEEAFGNRNAVYDAYVYITFGSDLIVADMGGKVVGYIALMNQGKDAKIISFAVRRQFRGMGIGTKLLRTAIERCKQRGNEKLYLEVRVSNHVAQRLYKKNGFEIIDVIPNYYNDGEDAYLMVLNLNEQ